MDNGEIAVLLQGVRADFAEERAKWAERDAAQTATTEAIKGLAGSIIMLVKEVNDLSAHFSEEKAKEKGPSPVAEALERIGERLDHIGAGVQTLVDRA